MALGTSAVYLQDWEGQVTGVDRLGCQCDVRGESASRLTCTVTHNTALSRGRPPSWHLLVCNAPRGRRWRGLRVSGRPSERLLAALEKAPAA